MFSFLNSTVLFAALAALIPLIIHLFSRRRVKVVEFSSVRHLKAMQKRQVRRLKIRQLLLLLLRMLIILMVVLAFARPTTKSGGVGAHASVSAVVLFDNSASMNRFVADGSLFDLARQRTEELLNTFGQSDQVLLMPLYQPQHHKLPLSFGSAAAAKEQLALLAPGYGKADYQSAVERASELLRSAPSLNREIYIISDRQRQSLPEEQVLAEAEANVFIVDLPLETVDNLGLTEVSFGGQLIRPGLQYTLNATVKNYGSEESGDRIASMFIDGRRVAQTNFAITGGAETAVKFTHTISSTGHHSGYVELSDDKYPGDNRYYFSFRIPEQFNLLIVNNDPAAQFIKLALVPTGDIVQSWSVKETNPEGLNAVNLFDFDVLVLAGAPNSDNGLRARIDEFTRTGHGVFITYGGGTDIQAYNRLWADLTGVTFQEPIRNDFSRLGFYSLQSLEMQHPIFSVFGFQDNKPPELKFYTLPQAQAGAGTQVLMRFTGNRPALVEKGQSSGKVLTFTGPMAPQYTDLPTHAFFVPFVSRIAEYLAADLSALDVRLFVDQAISRTPAYRGVVQNPFRLIAPDTTVYETPPEESNGALVVKSPVSHLPGVYSLRYLDREVDRFAVNADPVEGDLAEADLDQFASALGAREPRILEADASLASTIAGFRFGRELWQIFLWAALILMAIEMFLARSAQPEE